MLIMFLGKSFLKTIGSSTSSKIKDITFIMKLRSYQNHKNLKEATKFSMPVTAINPKHSISNKLTPQFKKLSFKSIITELSAF